MMEGDAARGARSHGGWGLALWGIWYAWLPSLVLLPASTVVVRRDPSPPPALVVHRTRRASPPFPPLRHAVFPLVGPRGDKRFARRPLLPPRSPPFPVPPSPPPHPPLAHSVVRCCTCPIFCCTRPSPAIDSPPGASTLRPAPLPSAARWGSHALLRVFGFGALGTVASERTGPAARWWWRGTVALNPTPGSHHRHHLPPACRARARGRQPRALRPCVAARSGARRWDSLPHPRTHLQSACHSHSPRRGAAGSGAGGPGAYARRLRPVVALLALAAACAPFPLLAG